MNNITLYLQKCFSGISPISEDLIASLYYRWLPLIAILIGVYIRIVEYLFNRSLWLDEAFIAVNFIDRSFIELFTAPLDYGHVVPPAFLAITKLIVSIFGVSDLTLRLFPFICGILSLILFYYLARAYLTRVAVPIAVTLFTISEPLIYYSSEFKPYSCDVATAITLLLLAKYFDNRIFDLKNAIIFSVAGGLAILFSLPSVFILFPVGLHLMASSLYKKNWDSLYLIFLSSISMLGVFTVLYFQFIDGLQGTKVGIWVTEWFNLVTAFMPEPFTMDWLWWLYYRLIRMMEYAVSSLPSELAAILFVLGILTFMIMHRQLVSFTLGPFFVVGIVSYYQLYPIHDRMILFLSPIVYIFISEFIARIRFTLSPYKEFSIFLYFYVVLIIYLVSVPILNHPREVQEIKPVLHYVQKTIKSTDKIYLYHWVEPAFRFYASDYGMDYNRCNLINSIQNNPYTKEVDHYRRNHKYQAISSNQTTCVLGISELYSQSIADLAKLEGNGNVWFIFSHIDHEKPKFLSHLDSIGTRLDESVQPGASAYLYRL